MYAPLLETTPSYAHVAVIGKSSIGMCLLVALFENFGAMMARLKISSWVLRNFLFSFAVIKVHYNLILSTIFV